MQGREHQRIAAACQSGPVWCDIACATYFASDLVGNFLERLPHSVHRTGGLEDDLSMGAGLLLESSLGAPVDVADDLANRLLELLAGRQLRSRERDALGVLSGEIHGCDSWAANSRTRRGGCARGAIGTIGRRDSSGLLAPGRDRSLSARLDRTESWEGFLRLCVQGGLLGSSNRLLGLLLAGSLLAQRSVRGGGSRRGRVCDILLI